MFRIQNSVNQSANTKLNKIIELFSSNNTDLMTNNVFHWRRLKSLLVKCILLLLEAKVCKAKTFPFQQILLPKFRSHKRIALKYIFFSSVNKFTVLIFFSF